MRQFIIGRIFDFRVLTAPKLYVRIGRLVFMYWSNEKFFRRFEFKME